MRTITAHAIGTLELHEDIEIEVPDHATPEEIAKALKEEAKEKFADNVMVFNGLELAIDIVDAEEVA